MTDFRVFRVGILLNVCSLRTELSYLTSIYLKFKNTFVVEQIICNWKRYYCVVELHFEPK